MTLGHRILPGYALLSSATLVYHDTLRCARAADMREHARTRTAPQRDRWSRTRETLRVSYEIALGYRRALRVCARLAPLPEHKLSLGSAVRTYAALARHMCASMHPHARSA